MYFLFLCICSWLETYFQLFGSRSVCHSRHLPQQLMFTFSQGCEQHPQFILVKITDNFKDKINDSGSPVLSEYYLHFKLCRNSILWCESFSFQTWKVKCSCSLSLMLSHCCSRAESSSPILSCRPSRASSIRVCSSPPQSRPASPPSRFLLWFTSLFISFNCL